VCVCVCEFLRSCAFAAEHSDSIVATGFSYNGMLFATGSLDSTVKVVVCERASSFLLSLTTTLMWWLHSFTKIRYGKRTLANYVARWKVRGVESRG